MFRCLATGAALAAMFALTPPAGAEEQRAEVIHWWTSGGESAAVKVFADQFQAAGGTWVDTAIAGGANARTAAINRTVGGNPPTAMQLNTGKQFDDLVENDLLANVDALAGSQNWKAILPAAFLQAVTRNGHEYAVPVNIHGQNWLFYSTAALAKAGTQPPTNWDDLFPALDKLKAAGLIPLAFSGQQNWERNLFNNVMVGRGGHDLFVAFWGKRDVAMVKSPEFRKIAETFKRLRDYVDPGSPGRNWNDATNLVIQGKAGMQFMGDWAKGEFTAAGKAPGKDYLCLAAPGSKGAYTFNIDSFVMFEQKSAGAKAGQQALAEAIMSVPFQETFNLNKGSIPARAGVPMAKFDQCAKDSNAEFQLSSKNGTLVPSWAHGMAIPASTQGALFDVVTQFFNSDMSPKDAAQKLAQAGKTK
jgi:glucose/mannose transport system substrate-binding protein